MAVIHPETARVGDKRWWLIRFDSSTKIRAHVVPASARLDTLRYVEERYGFLPKEQIRTRLPAMDPGGMTMVQALRVLELPDGYRVKFNVFHVPQLIMNLNRASERPGELLKMPWGQFGLMMIPKAWVPALVAALEPLLAEGDAQRQDVLTELAGCPHVKAPAPRPAVEE